MRRFFLIVLGLFFYAGTSFAQDYYNNEVKSGLDSFSNKSQKYSFNKKDNKPIPTKEVAERIKADATKIIFEPEEVLCFGVNKKAVNFEGATLDGFALSGNCGKLTNDAIKDIQTNVFGSVKNVDFREKLKCVVDPKVVLRFKKGIDFTDVIFSSGCYMAKVMYAGESSEFNITPIASWTDDFIGGVSKNMTKVETAVDTQTSSDFGGQKPAKVWAVPNIPQVPSSSIPSSQSSDSTATPAQKQGIEAGKVKRRWQ